jgi:hypothetical protein
MSVRSQGFRRYAAACLHWMLTALLVIVLVALASSGVFSPIFGSSVAERICTPPDHVFPFSEPNCYWPGD